MAVVVPDITYPTASGTVPSALHPLSEPTIPVQRGQYNKAYNSLFKSDNVAGRLDVFYDFWRDKLKASDFILDAIRFGYRIPFYALPPPCNHGNNLSSKNNASFVRKEIEDLLGKGYVSELNSIPFCCNPLTVASVKKLRLVLDLSRHVN